MKPPQDGIVRRGMGVNREGERLNQYGPDGKPTGLVVMIAMCVFKVYGGAAS